MINLPPLAKLIEAFAANFLRWVLPKRFGGWGGHGGGSNGRSDGGRCPFEVLGLEGGGENLTLEEATKARRQLALQWHPDRNIDNAEEATQKMQEINYAFIQVEKIISSRGNDETDDREDHSDKSNEDRDSDGHMSKAARKKARRKANKKTREEAAEFERELNKEMKNFARAHRNAQFGTSDSSFYQRESTSFASSPSPPSPANGMSRNNASGRGGKGKSKAAKKRARKKAARATLKQDNGLMHQHMARNTATPESNHSNVQFHRLSPEERIEIKFGSSHVTKSQEYAAMRAKTYNVLKIMFTVSTDPADPISLPPDDAASTDAIFVTPLMVASYLGDYLAADVLISCLESKWSEAVLAKSHKGDDCLSLAMEAKDIGLKLYDESKGHMNDATTDEERARQGDIIDRYKNSYDEATNLVERLESMKGFALEERKKRKTRQGIGLLVIGSVGACGYCYYGTLWGLCSVAWSIVKLTLIGLLFCAIPVGTSVTLIIHYWLLPDCLRMPDLTESSVLGRVWNFILWGCIKYMVVFVAAWMKPLGISILLLVIKVVGYWIAEEDEEDAASSPETEHADAEPSDVNDVFQKAAHIDIFCADGETCLNEGDECRDGITEECCGRTYHTLVCECGANLRYSCHAVDACLDRACEPPEVHVMETMEVRPPLASPSGPLGGSFHHNETFHRGHNYQHLALGLVGCLCVSSMLFLLLGLLASGARGGASSKRAEK